jgi:hypothetical protein
MEFILSLRREGLCLRNVNRRSPRKRHHAGRGQDAPGVRPPRPMSAKGGPTMAKKSKKDKKKDKKSKKK